MSTSLADRHARVRAGLSLRDRDPLSFFRFAVPRIRDAIASLSDADSPVDELAARSCNGGGKSLGMATVGLALAQKRPTLDGVPLPQWRGPLTMVQLCLDYPQQVLSVQPAYEKMLGNWPHKARKNGDTLQSLRVMPVGGSSDVSTWSVIRFMSERNKLSGTGVRSDVVLFDEPPPIEILRELRKAKHAGRRGIRLTWFTPTIRRQWAPLKEDYGDGPRSSFRRIGKRWAEVRWSLDEVADWVLTDAEKAALIEDWAKDPLAEARRHGDYVDASASCPFRIPQLLRMLEECVEPDVRDWWVKREVPGDTGVTKAVTNVKVLVLKDPVPGHRYYLNIDPSKGIEPSSAIIGFQQRLDPGGILVHDETEGEDVALYEGYIGSYGLGTLAAGLAVQYNYAAVDPESNSGWAEGVMRGLADAGYANVYKRVKVMEQGRETTKWGFDTTTETRPAMIEQLQAWQDAYGGGVVYARCQFARVIQTLLDTVLDLNGKPVAAPGFHDEFMILKGQQLRRLHRVRDDRNLARAAMPPEPVIRRGGMTGEELTKRLLGPRADEAPLQGIPPLIPKPRGGR